MVNLDQRQSVINNADTVNAQLTTAPSDDKFVAKPQVVATSTKSYKDIKQYIVEPGDTVASIAEKFGVTSDSIMGTNNLFSNAVREGSELTIPPVSGIVYTVKEGDTPSMLAQRFQANEQALIAFNDGEVRGFEVGQRIMIPGGVQQAVRAVAMNTSPSFGGGFAWGGYAPVYGGNGYDRGYCTWWAAARRAQIGRPIPNNLGNAITWNALAQRAGLAVGNTPAQGAVIWHPPHLSATYLGHVAFVEEVYPDGSIRVSDMNARGWGVVTERTLTPNEASAYSYIY